MRGKLLDLWIYSGNDSAILKKYNSIIKLNTSRFVVLKDIDEELCLVAMCREEPQTEREKFNTDKGFVYVNVKSFYTVHKTFCSVSSEKLLFSQTVVNDIYRLHNEWKDDLKKLKAARRETKKKSGVAAPKIESMTIRKNYDKVEPPSHLQWAVKHPYQGGGFSGK